jgi:hypothetical protein
MQPSVTTAALARKKPSPVSATGDKGTKAPVSESLLFIIGADQTLRAFVHALASLRAAAGCHVCGKPGPNWFHDDCAIFVQSARKQKAGAGFGTLVISIEFLPC